jgi:hypothetical protein
MFILSVSILLLIAYQSECAMRAKAILHGDNSMATYGTLTFSQPDADKPVHITGRVSGLNASSAHVCLIIRRKKRIKFCFRVFMFIQILYQKIHRIVQLPLVILILTVNS